MWLLQERRGSLGRYYRQVFNDEAIDSLIFKISFVRNILEVSCVKNARIPPISRKKWVYVKNESILRKK